MLTQVRDIYCAAYLMAKGAGEPAKVERAEDGFINFFFPAREASPLLSEWYGPDATVNVHDFIEAQKQLRQVVRKYEQRR